MTGFRRRFQELFERRRVDQETREEMRQHFELLVARNRESGATDAEARRLARLELGDVDEAGERAAEQRTGGGAEILWKDVVIAARSLRRSPGLASLAVVTMAVGIGASAFLFALVNGVVLEPLPFPDAERLVRIVDVNPTLGIARTGVTSGNVAEWRVRTKAFDGIAGYFAMGRTLTTDAGSTVVITAQVTDGYFRALGVPAALGRVFTPEETARSTFSSSASPTGPDPVAILSDRIWRTRFGSDPAIVGKTVLLERRPARIIGVMPESFVFPDRQAQIWIPWSVTLEHPKDQHYLGGIARLAPGASMAEADAELRAVAQELGAAFPRSNAGWSQRLLPLREDVVGGAARVLWLLFGAVALLLAVACVNVALLTLIRGLDRAGDAAVRLALGASQTRLLREFFLESALVACLGGALGALLAFAAVAALPAIAPDLPRVDDVRLDPRTVAFMAAITCLAGLLSGLPQALRRSRLAPSADLAGDSRRTTEGRRRTGLRDGLVVAQVALAVVLLVGSGLLVRSVSALAAVEPGFDPRGVLVAPVFLDSQAYSSGEKTRAYYATLFERLAALPGVVAVGAGTTVPTSPLGPDFERPVWPEGSALAEPERPAAWVRIVTPGYFKALGLNVAAGRPFDGRDRPDSQYVAMVSRTLARRLFPGGEAEAVGKHLQADYSTAGVHTYEIVGVVGDIRFRGPRSEPQSEIYVPHAQRSYLVMNVVVKTATDPIAIIPAVQSAMRDIDPQKPAHGFRPLEELLGATYARDRQAMAALLVFSISATFLAMLSVYGALSQRVREREREIAIRMTMGAAASGVVSWITRAGARLVATGLAVGLGVALGIATAAASSIEGVLFHVRPTDLIAASSAILLVAVVGVASALVPAWRATRIDPLVALRRS